VRRDSLISHGQSHNAIDPVRLLVERHSSADELWRKWRDYTDGYDAYLRDTIKRMGQASNPLGQGILHRFSGLALLEVLHPRQRSLNRQDSMGLFLGEAWGTFSFYGVKLHICFALQRSFWRRRSSWGRR
jgi:hypothetical protein